MRQRMQGEKNRVLFVSNLLSHIKAFHIPYINWFKNRNWEIHVLTNANSEKKPEYIDKLFDVPIYRSPYDLRNIKAYYLAKEIIEEGCYDIIHCHTPMGGVIGRLASRRERKKGTKIIYTAHGFHFYKGAPLFNWLTFYTVEWLLSNYTDCIITINREDFVNARKLLNKKISNNYSSVYQILGIGVDSARFFPADIEEKNRLKLSQGYQNKFLIVYVAEFIKRKNHLLILEAAKMLKRDSINVKFVLVGEGVLIEKVKRFARKLGVLDKVEFLGYRKDVPEILRMSDIFISTSTEEGFGLAIAEGLFSGLPAVVSDVRGHREMVKDGYNGFFFSNKDLVSFVDRIKHIYRDVKLHEELSQNALKSAQQFSIDNSIAAMEKIYMKYMQEHD